MYKVFNQLTGVYTIADNIDHAKSLFNEYYSAFTQARINAVPSEVTSPSDIHDTEIGIAEAMYTEVLKSSAKGTYTNTGFNLDTEEKIFTEITFYNPTVITKIDPDGTVSDFICEFPVNDSEREKGYIYFVVDLNDHNRSRYAKYSIKNTEDRGTVFCKHDYFTDEILSESSTLPSAVPSKYNAILDKYPEIKNNITAHGQREHGYIVYYNDPVDLIPNPDYNTTVEQIKQEAFEHVSVIYEEENENGFTTTEIIDTTNWIE